MATRKKAAAAQAAPPAQGAPAPADQAPANPPQEAPGRPRSAPGDQARPDAPGDQARAAQARPRIPGTPRDFRPETRTRAQAEAELGPDEFLWPWPGPKHGIKGFSELAGWAAQDALGGEQTPEAILGTGQDVLLILITNAKYLNESEVIKNVLIAEHDKYGRFYLRCVAHPKDGFLIGIIDDQGATYCACEWYETREDAADAWKDWAALLND